MYRPSSAPLTEARATAIDSAGGTARRDRNGTPEPDAPGEFVGTTARPIPTRVLLAAPGPAAHDRETAAADEVVLTNARLVTADEVVHGTVRLAGGVIADIDTGRSRWAGARDLEGDVLLPGLVDIHTDNLERHLEPRPGVAWPNTAALVSHDREVAAAGVTTVFDALCVGDYEVGKAGRRDALVNALQAMERAQSEGLLSAEHLLHLRCELSAPDVVTAFAAAVGDPLVRLVSVMDHTPGQRQWRDLDQWRLFNSRSALSEADLLAIIERRRRVQADQAQQARAEIVRICRERGLAVATHDDTTAEHVIEAAADGVAISEFPTTLEAARLARDAGIRVVMGAPNVVLGGSHCGNVSARALAAEGLVDGLASDYVPVSLLQACWLLHESLGMPLPAAVATVTANTAAMVGLDDRGRIEIGRRADLVRVRAYERMAIVRGVWRQGRRVA